jgi:ketosteroid isomerase-like protein
MLTSTSAQIALALLAIQLGLAAFSSAQTTSPSAANQLSDSTPIRKILDTQQAAWNRGDIPAFLEGYWNSPDVTFSGANGTVRGYSGLLDRYRKTYPDTKTMGQLEFLDVEIRMLGSDAALVLGKWHLARSIGDIGGVFTLVFQRFPAGWRIIHDHTSAQKAGDQVKH